MSKAGAVVDSQTMVDAEAVDTEAQSAIDEAAAPAGDGDVATAPALLRVVKGNPSPEELAVLVAVVAAASGNGGDGSDDAGPRDMWGDLDDALDGMPRMFSPRAYQSGRFGGR
ncbi:acyl-CoA carboxylase subunit epsilon [Tomitella fengzijianii]|uniref:acyl-CoA carboxylase subunit epsilon n=1 Tax=Tomitella fengzijianii TaxID=2597660 RepID=UPI001F35CB47|nr:acyl-CoA carboxylase subunit epsilon [Tomitella fengzijianii]